MGWFGCDVRRIIIKYLYYLLVYIFHFFQKQVIALGLAYLTFSATYDIVLNVGSIDDLAYGARVFLVLPIAVCDAVFILWIFTALSKTLEQLQVRRQTAKLALYR